MLGPNVEKQRRLSSFKPMLGKIQLVQMANGLASLPILVRDSSFNWQLIVLKMLIKKFIVIICPTLGRP
jgi:hypothetical protein